MKAILFLFSAILFLQSLSCATASVEEICKKLKDDNFNFCVTSLQADPSSRTADAKGLAIIATNLAKANATRNLEKVKKLFKDPKTDPETKKSLDVCQDVYTSAVEEISDATGQIKSHDLGAATNNLSSASTDISTCDDAFAEQPSGNTTLLLKDNDIANQITCLALGLTTLLH